MNGGVGVGVEIGQLPGQTRQGSGVAEGVGVPVPVGVGVGAPDLVGVGVGVPHTHRHLGVGVGVAVPNRGVPLGVGVPVLVGVGGVTCPQRVLQVCRRRSAHVIDFGDNTSTDAFHSLVRDWVWHNLT